MKKILIIKLSALGDIFMALPHVETILDHHSDDRVWILTSPPFKDLFINHPRLNVATLDRKGWVDSHCTWRTIMWVRRQEFTTIYDLQGNRISRLIVRFSGADQSAGTQPKPVYDFHPTDPYTRETQQNVFDRLNETLHSAGLKPASPGCTLFPSESDKRRVNQWKLENEIKDGRYAVLHAGSSREWVSKRWPEDRFAKLAEYIEAAGVRCVWVGSDADRAVNDYLAQKAGVDATAQFSILQLYILGKHALFAVTNDSGPMHIFAAAGIPVYSFFGPTSWVRSHAAGQKTRVIRRDVACSPCFLATCPPSKQHMCLDTIDPESVFDTIQEENNLISRLSNG